MPDAIMSITIREKASGAVLASGIEGLDAVSYEGNWYFLPESVAAEGLVVTERTYTCPYKGVCYWVDFAPPGGAAVQGVAWIYREPKPGHEIVQGRYGFYAGSRGPTKQD